MHRRHHRGRGHSRHGPQADATHAPYWWADDGTIRPPAHLESGKSWMWIERVDHDTAVPTMSEHTPNGTAQTPRPTELLCPIPPSRALAVPAGWVDERATVSQRDRSSGIFSVACCEAAPMKRAPLPPLGSRRQKRTYRGRGRRRHHDREDDRERRRACRTTSGEEDRGRGLGDGG
jgi:hypothetical protein